MSPDARRRVVVLSLAMSVALAACSTTGATSPTPASTSPSAARPATTAPSQSAAAAFPVTLTDDEGTAVELAAEPQVIVSLTPATTEILFEIGAGDRVVATDDGSDYPAEAIDLPDVASSYTTVDVEQVVNLDPDLVIAGGLGFTPTDAITQLRSLDVPVMVVYAPSLEGVYKDVDLLGTATGTSEKAAAVTAAMRAEIDAISDAVAGGTRPRVFYEVGYDATTGAIFAPADESFVAEMVTLAGGDTITTGDPNTYEIGLEKLIERDPEVIVLGVNPFYEPTPEEVAARPGWNVMTAIKNDDVRTVRDIEINRPGPRLPVGLRNLAAIIRPDVRLPDAP